MKKIISVVAVMLISIVVCICSSCGAKQPLDLRGEWLATNEINGVSQKAIITDDTIEIFWLIEKDGTIVEYLYWSGTYVLPTEPCTTYSWQSVNDYEKTRSEWFASSDNEKQMNYNDGCLSYSVSVSGMTTTLYLEKK